ncbi:MAG: RNA polymerase factor sigma-54 [Pseudomonadota bacterium]
MAAGPKLNLRQTQSLVMTPQLRQAIRLLQLSTLDVAAYVEEQLEQNPLLERDESELGAGDGTEIEEPSDAASFADPPAAAAPLLDPIAGLTAAEPEPPLEDDGSEPWGANSGESAAPARAGAARNGRNGEEDRDSTFEQAPARAASLRDHLLGQINVDLDDPADRIIAVHLIDLLDESGYLTGDLEALARLLNCEVARIKATVERLQGFDPPGVFARSLKECLSLQLRDRNRCDLAMAALLDNLTLLAARDFAALQRICGVDAAQLTRMVAEVRSLNPKPGLAFETEIAQTRIPDVWMARARDGGWIVELNEEALPRVLVNSRYYAQIAKGLTRKSDRDYVSERLQSASWLVKSLNQRAETILRVATEIVRQQDAFFRRGVSRLRPLILRDIAGALELHESTVSRVTNNKYLAAPHGIYELKFFFTTALPSSNGGADHSAAAVRHRVRELIDAESLDHALSDDRIVGILKSEGVDIARRTVAKYRESLSIPSSLDRRRRKLAGAMGPWPNRGVGFEASAGKGNRI